MLFRNQAAFQPFAWTLLCMCVHSWLCLQRNCSAPIALICSFWGVFELSQVKCNIWPSKVSVSFRKIYLTILEKVRKRKRKKVLGPSSHLIAEASLPILKLNKHSTLCSAHFSKRWCQFSWKDLETDKMDSQWGILYHLDLSCSPCWIWYYIYARSYFIM